MADQMPQHAWSDGRVDEFAGRTDVGLREVRCELRDLREKIDRRSDIELGVMATGLVGLIVAHFIG
jgi:hypothetical protein